MERLPANTQESRNFVIACNRYSYSLKWDRPLRMVKSVISSSSRSCWNVLAIRAEYAGVRVTVTAFGLAMMRVHCNKKYQNDSYNSSLNNKALYSFDPPNIKWLCSRVKLWVCSNSVLVVLKPKISIFSASVHLRDHTFDMKSHH